MYMIGHFNVRGIYRPMSSGVYVLGGKCPGVIVQGVSFQGVVPIGGGGGLCPWGMSRRVHVQGGLSCHHNLFAFKP